MDWKRRQNILDRILARVHYNYEKMFNGSPCWEWTGPTSGEGRGGGYGRISISGITCAVHIVVFTHFFGFVPRKKQIDHKCNNRICCNPDHLEIVTHKENQKRKRKR